jgi:two-component system, OmpR family, phosphate regulon sensor histidine kinase PhoR
MSRQAALNALETAIVLLENGRVTGLNSAAENLFGTTSQRAQNRSPIEILRNHRLERLALEGGSLNLELFGRTFRAKAVPGALLLDDISRSLKREAELREVMAVLSHEFRTPVAAIKSLLEALALEPPPETRANFVQMSLLEVERLVRLVEDLTVGFRPQAERTLPLLECLERVRRLTGEELEKRQVKLEFCFADVLVRCDPDKLVQVLLNLIENAARHAPNPGLVRVFATRADAFWRIGVVDQGQPLPDYVQIFEAQRRSAQSRGSGMGLYIVKTIVRAWSGEVGAQHRTDLGGNEFFFSVSAG